ncbi:hypothetical protein HMI54_005533 [Coelomomyces lativittatus]|nr:hypothetical protein HMI54_005533 [Coelomomyces lativittatus]
MLAAPSLISPFHLETLWKTVMSIQDQHLHSFGSEHTRNGLCRLIECLSIASPIGKLDKTWVQNFFKLLESSWERKEESLQLDAAQAAGFLIKHVSQNEAEAFIEEWCDKLCTLTTPLLTKIGLTRVLGMVAQISTATLTMALNALINTMQLPKDHSDATLRKSVMISLGQVLHESLGSECISSALKCFQKGLEDYTITAQGDIGSWVRMAAMEALLTKAAHIDWSKHPHSSFHLFLKCLFQCLSRIDKVRCVASQCTQGLLPYFKHLPDYTFLTTTLFRTNEDWSHSLIAFQSLVPLLELDTYRDTILFGYLLCIGAGSVSTERDATEVLLSFIEAKQCEAPILYKLAKSLVSIYNQNVHGTERNLVPFFSALHLLYCNQSFSFEMTSTHDQFFEIISRALQTTSSVVKLNLLLKCCCCFMSIPSTCHRALQLATQFLIHEVPRLRKAAAEQILIFLPLYLLNMHDDVTTSLVHQGKNDTSFMLLIETDWTQSSLESLQDTCQRFITSVT